jgi:hypothetical protein
MGGHDLFGGYGRDAVLGHCGADVAFGDSRAPGYAE